jgi:hypothetical protein
MTNKRMKTTKFGCVFRPGRRILTLSHKPTETYSLMSVRNNASNSLESTTVSAFMMMMIISAERCLLLTTSRELEIAMRLVGGRVRFGFQWNCCFALLVDFGFFFGVVVLDT